MAENFRHYRPPGYRNPAGLRGPKAALISRRAHRACAMLAPLNNARGAARRVLARAADQQRPPVAIARAGIRWGLATISPSHHGQIT